MLKGAAHSSLGLYNKVAEFIPSMNNALSGYYGKFMVVYFIQAGTKGAIKIGHTANLEKRLENLQVGNPFELRVLATIHCDSIDHARYMEGQLHKFFKRKHIRGEWFKSTIRIFDYNHCRLMKGEQKK